MPALDASIANIRTSGGYAFETYFTTPTETVIFRALVNQTTFTYPLQTLTFDTVTVGAFGDIAVDMEVVIYNQSTSTVKGRLRVANGAASSTVLQVEEFSQGRLSIANNDKIEVLRSWRVRNKIVGATSTFPKDSRITYTDQGSNPAPICNSGGHWVGFVDDGQIYATVHFTGSTSFNVDPDSGATVNHSWTFPSGTPSSSTSADPSVQFPVGEYWVTHVATDASNSKTTTQYVYVRVYNQTTTRPDECLIEERSANELGWRVRVTIPGGKTLTQMPDGALIVLWEREYRNITPTSAGTVISYGSNSSGRSHVKFVGYVIGDSITEDAITGTVTFEAVNPAALLDQIPGFSQVILRRVTPTNWRGVKGLTTNRALIYMLRWHSSLLTAHDLILSVDNHNYPALYIEQNALGNQIREIVDGVDGAFGCDMVGRVLIQQRLQLATSAERTAATTTLTLTDLDVLRVDLERNHRYTYSQLEGRGFIAATAVANSKPLLSLAPGNAPVEAPAKTVQEKLIISATSSQSDLNSRTGWRFAHQSATLNGLPTSRGSITLSGSYDVFDIYQEWVKLTLSTSYNKRGVSFSSTRFVITGISISYNPSDDPATGLPRWTKEVRLTIEEECDGAAGVTKAVPQPQNNNLPSFTLPEFEFPFYAPPTPVGMDTGIGTIQALLQGTTRYNTTDFNAFLTTWVSSATAGISGTVCDWVVDAFSPKYLTGTGFVNAKVVTTTGIYDVTDLFGTPTATLRETLTTITSTLHRRIYATRGRQNFFAVVTYYGAGVGVACAVTTDSINWTENTVSAHYNSTVAGIHGTSAMKVCGAISEHTGYIYCGAYTATGAGQAATSTLYRSIDDGASWAAQGDMTNARWTGYDMHFPYHDNATDRYFYWTKCDSATTIVLMRTDRVLGTQTQLDAVPGSATSHGGRFVHTCAVDRRSVAVVTFTPSGSNYALGVSVSRDGGANFVNRVAPVIASRWLNCEVSGDNPNIIYLMGEDGMVGYSTDFGATIQDKSIGVATDVVRLVGN